MRHIISLSTIPPRFDRIGTTLASLLAQKARPESIRLYLPRSYRRFPGYDGAVPEVPDGVTILRVDTDFGPATKVLPAARDLRGQAVDILYCDDDHHYAPDWSSRLLAVRAARPNAAVTARGTSVDLLWLPDYAPKPQPQAVRSPQVAEQLGYQLRRLWAERPRKGHPPPTLAPSFRVTERSGYTDIAEGYAGVAIRPDFLDDAAFDIPPVLWSVDDVWLSGHLARRGVGIWADARLNHCCRMVIDASATQPLYEAKVAGAGRREANQACATWLRETYGIWGGAPA